MKDHITRFKSTLRDQMYYMVAFAVLFAAVGYLVDMAPRFYFKYLDRTTYYEFSNPITLEKKEYCPCSDIIVRAARKSLIELPAVSIKTLVLVRDGGETVDISKEVTMINTTRGDGFIQIRWQLPCTIDPGTYYYRGILLFKVHEVEKTANFITERFRIVPEK